MSRRLSILLVLPLSWLFAQEKPNYAGTWVLNRDASQNASHNIESQIWEIQQRPGSIRWRAVVMLRDQGRQEATFDLKIGGAPILVDGVKMDASWDGDSLKVVRQWTDQERVQIEHWVLSPDKKRLTVDTLARREGQEFHSIRVSDRR